MKITHYQTYRVNPDDFKKYCRFLEIAYACKFYSMGKNGKFELRILISRYRDSLDPNSFYLAFGAWNELSQDLDDKIETKNDDMQLILVLWETKLYNFFRIILALNFMLREVRLPVRDFINGKLAKL